MKNYKFLAIPLGLAVVFGLSAFGYSNIPVKSQLNNPKDGVVISTSYTAEVKDPKWSVDSSKLIVQGDIIEIGNAAEGVSQVNGDLVVYTDNLVKVTKIVKNTSGKDLKPGDVISVRVLGGSIKNFTYSTDTEGILTKGKHTLLCLVDVSEQPGYPSDNSKQIFTIVGAFHGAFELNEDGTVTRVKTGESYKLDFIESLAK